MFTPYFLVQHLSWDCHPCTLQHQKGESQQLREVSDLIGVPIASWLQSLIFIHCSSIWVGILTVHGTADNMRCSMLQQVTGAEDNQLPGCQVVQLPSKSPPAHCSGLAIGLVDDYRAWFDPFRVLGVPWCWNNMGVSALTAASFCQSSPFHHLGDENQSSHSSLYSSFLKKSSSTWGNRDGDRHQNRAPCQVLWTPTNSLEMLGSSSQLHTCIWQARPPYLDHVVRWFSH